MAQLKIIRASAGAGKTFRLTQEVLLLLLKEPRDYYKHILAVTFTNKATAEMKERILSELHALGNNQKSAHLETLCSRLNKPENKIRQKAQSILLSILHGYSWFRVETIDSFFQGVIRAFVRELNIAGYYSIELNQKRILDIAIDHLLNKVSDDSELSEWLLEYISSKQDEGKSWSINKELEDLGQTIFKENLVQKLPKIKAIIENREFLSVYKNTLKTIVNSFDSKIKDIASKVQDMLEKSDLSEKDFFQTSKGPAGYFKKLIKGDYSPINSYVAKVLDDPEKYPSGSSKRKDEAESFGINHMTPAILAITRIIEEDIEDYNTSKSILKNLHIFGVLSTLNNEIQNVREEEGVFLISDAAPFIQKIINQNDTPFIYEKIGNQFNHLLIDEFQDTSNLQWENFKPLLSNSLSKDKDCLVVGDVKQSIYRWRNSNWDILANQIEKDFSTPGSLDKQNLDTNWRSDANIIRFNNIFFDLASKLLQNDSKELETELPNPESLYIDTKQIIPEHKDEENGYVNFKLFSKEEVADNKEEYWQDELIMQINSFLEKNYLPGQIALLVRTKAEGTKLANFLIEANNNKHFIKELSVISNESLLLINSPAVKILIAALNFINNPNERLYIAEIIQNFNFLNNHTQEALITTTSDEYTPALLDTIITPNFSSICKQLKNETLLIIVENLTAVMNLYDTESELVYIHSFLDLIYEYSNRNLTTINRFLDYWEEEGSDKSISTAEAEDSIRIYTIHKSKGLEFPIVILPFANWGMSNLPGEKIWVTPKKEPYNKLEYLPVNLSKELENSIFQRDYNDEKYQTIIDNLNLLYVAFTRARSALIVFSITNKKQNTAYVIENVLSQIASETFPLKHNIDESRYIMGKIDFQPEKDISTPQKRVEAKAPNLNLPEIKFLSRSEQFLSNNNALNTGNTLHKVMEEVITTNDIHRVIYKKAEEGILEKQQAEAFEAILKKALESPEIKSWFDGTYHVLTENDIILPSQQIRRPDRIMLAPQNTIVVDYKFGGDDDKNKHIKQVKEYMQLLNQSGLENLSGYVWYVLENNLVFVSIN